LYKQEALPPGLQLLIGAGLRVVIGAILGYVVALAVLFTHVWLWGDTFGVDKADIWRAAYHTGATLGAISYPLAWLLFLKGENERGAMVAACISAYILGVVGIWLVGPRMPGVAATVGFWGTCAAIYRQRRSSKRGAGFQGYFR
jgi:hypothetical protein